MKSGSEISFLGQSRFNLGLVSTENLVTKPFFPLSHEIKLKPPILCFPISLRTHYRCTYTYLVRDYQTYARSVPIVLRVYTEKFDIIVGCLSVDISVASIQCSILHTLCRKPICRRGGFWLARSPEAAART